MSDNEFTVKVDVLDFLIEILREHEKVLSEQIESLQETVDRMNKERKKRK